MELEFKITEQPKQIPKGMQAVLPAIEIATVIKKNFAGRNEAKKIREAQKEQENALLSQLATYVFLMEKALERLEKLFIEKGLKNVFREFRILKNQMKHALEEYNISIFDPIGRILDDELEEKVEVIGWVFAEGERRVKETHEPVILRDNEVIRIGRVIVSSPSAIKPTQKEGGFE